MKGIVAEDRDQLWESLRALKLQWKVLKDKVLSQELSITTECGRVYTYIAFDDIPKRSLVCGCGKEYVILYRADIVSDKPS